MRAGGLQSGVVVPAGMLLVDGTDSETARRLSALGSTGRTREQALTRLHGPLLRVAHAELSRRAGRHPITGPELDDLAYQSADNALFAITTKLAQLRGNSRFTTWAYKFAVREVSSKLGRTSGSVLPQLSTLLTGTRCPLAWGPVPSITPSGTTSSPRCAVPSRRI